MFKAQGKERFRVATYGKRNENAAVAWDYVENTQGKHMFCAATWKTLWKHSSCVGLFWKRTERHVSRSNVLKTLWKHSCCVGLNWKRKENTCCAQQRMENWVKTQLLRWIMFKTQGKDRFRVATYRKRYENTVVAWDYVENVEKTIVLRSNARKTVWKHSFCVGLCWTRKEHKNNHAELFIQPLRVAYEPYPWKLRRTPKSLLINIKPC